MGRALRREGPYLVLLLLLPFLFFASVTVGGKTLIPADALYLFEPFKSMAAAMHVPPPHNPLLADLVLENYPWQRFLQEAGHLHELPLWDPFIFSGHPFFANGQHSALYPLRLVVFALFPLWRAYGIFIALQLGLAGLSAYLLGRVIGASPGAAFLGGLAFQFSGFLVVSVVHPMIVAAASWLPALLAFIALTMRRHPFLRGERAALPWALGGAVVLGLSMLAGHAEITYFTLLVAMAFAAWLALWAAFTLPRRQWVAELFRPLGAVAILFLLGGGLAMVQYLPLYEVARLSFRQDAVSLAQVLSWAYPKRRLITFFVPNFFGNPTHRVVWDFFRGVAVPARVNACGQPTGAFDWGLKNYVEGGAYVGLLTLALAAIALLRPPARERRSLRDRPYTLFFALLALFSLGCIFGTPIYRLVYALPFLSQSHSPFRWVFPLTVSLVALAMLGATAVEEGPRRAVRSPRGLVRVLLLGAPAQAVSWVAAAAFWGGAWLLVLLWATRLAFARVEPFVERLFRALANAANAFPDARTFYLYEFPQVERAALLMLATGIVLRLSRTTRRAGRRPLWHLLAGLLLLTDLWLFGAGFNPQTDPAWLEVEPPVVRFLREDHGVWRFSTFDPHGHKLFNANSGMLFDFQDVRGYDSLFTAQYARYMGWIEPQGELPYNRIAPFSRFESLDSPLLDLLNVKYIITDVEIPLPRYRLVYDDAALKVYENLGVMPRAFTLPRSATIVVPTQAAVGETIRRYDPRFYLIADEETLPEALRPAEGSAQPGEPRAQAVVAYGLDQVVVEAEVDGPAWLVLGDAYFPGWKAFVSPAALSVEASQEVEEEVPVVRTAGNFRAVPLEAGRWRVRFKYSPDSVKIGAFLSFLSGMVLVFLAVVWGWRYLYREENERSTIHRIAKNSIVPIALNLFNRMIDFAFAALMLRLLGPANAGDYYYAIVIFGWFEILTNFGLDAYLTREVARHREQGNRYFFNTMIVRLVLVAVGIPLLVLFIALRQTLVHPPAPQQAIVALLLLYGGLVPGSISKGLTSLFYAYEKAEYPAAIATLTTLLKVMLGTVALLLGWGIVGLAGFSIVINVVTMGILLWLALRLFFRFRREPDGRLRREMLSESWPLMLNHLLATLFFKVDVVLLEAVWGSAVVGWYSTAYKFLDALNIIPAMFTFAVFPIVSRQAREDRGAFLRSYRLGVKLLFALALPAVVVTTLFAKELVLLLGDRAYLPHSQIALQVMIWSIPIGWMNSLTNYELIALDQQRYLTRAFFIGVTFNVIANLLLMPRYGYPASALITILSELALFIPFSVGMRRQLGPIGWWGILGKPLLAAAAMGGAIALLLPVGKAAAGLGAVLAYLLAMWRLAFFSPQERAMLAPLVGRGSS